MLQFLNEPPRYLFFTGKGGVGKTSLATAGAVALANEGRPETTPVLEAAQLQADLRRAEIEPYGWIVNQSLAASGPTDPLLVERALAERRQVQVVADRHAARTFLVPWTAYDPVGAEALLALLRGRAVLEVPNPEPAYSSPA